MRHLSACLATIASLLLFPAFGSAATTVGIVAGAGATGGGVQVQADPASVVNALTITKLDQTHIRVVDTAAPLTPASPSCSPVTANHVECTVTKLAADVIAGGGDDAVTIVGDLRTYISGDTGDDTITGGDGVDELEGGSGDDTLKGGDGNDFLYDSYSGGTSGDDDLDGEGGSDLLYGGKGADTLSDSGATGIDAVTYSFATSAVTLRVADGIANDGTGVVHGADAADLDEVQTGLEKIQGSPNFGDTIVGGPAAETINGSGGDDDLDGGPGADTLEGNGGNDTIRSRDDIADAHLACDSPSDPAGSAGTTDKAFIDAADPDPAGCETVDRLAAPAPTTPPTTPGPGEPTAPAPGAPAPIVDTGLQPLCPTSGSIFLRPSSTFGANTRVTISVPAAGWFVLAQLISTADGTSLLGSPRAARSTKPGNLDVPVSFYAKPPAAGTSIRVAVTVFAPDCRPVSVADDVVIQPAGAAKSAAAPPKQAPPLDAARRSQAREALPAGAPPTVGVDSGGRWIFDCSAAAWATFNDFQKAVIAAAAQKDTGVCQYVPEPAAEPKCEQLFGLVSFVKMAGKCIKEDPKTKVLRSEAKVTINGIDISFGAGGSVTFNPKTKELVVSGRHKVEIPLFFNGRSQGAVVLRDALADASPIGFKLTLSDLVLDLKTPGGKNLGGFLLDTGASAKLSFNKDGGELDLRLKLPKKFGNAHGGTRVVWNAQGIELKDAVIKLPAIKIGRMSLSEGELRYELKDGKTRWFGKITMAVPAPKALSAPEVEVKATFINGGLTDGSVEVTGINKPFGHPAVWLQRIKATLVISENEVTFGGEADITLGPKVKDTQVGRIEGKTSFTFAEPGVWKGSGEFSLLTDQKGDGSFSYTTDGKLDFEGRLQLPFLIMNVDGRVKGTVALPNTFKVAGQVDLAIVGLPSVQADLNANEKAMTICGTVKGVSVGATIPYATRTPEFLTGCGLAPWGKPKPPKGDKKALRLATTAASTSLPKGLPQAAFSAKGQGGVPNVVLVGPGDRTLQVGVDSPDGIAFADPSTGKVYFMVGKPAAGEWRLDVQDGSVPVTDVEVAEGLQPAKVKAKVTTDGSKRVLHYDVDGPNGQRVQFFERAVGVERAIKTVSGSGKGTAKFTPADGVSGKRDIVAFVEQDGLSQGEGEKVATFRAGPTLKPGQPGCIASNNGFSRPSSITIGGDGTGDCMRIKVTRGGSGDQVTVTWGKSPEAENYRVLLTTSGRKDVQILGESARKFVFKDIERDGGVKVEVVGLNENGAAGPAIRAELDAAKIKPTTKKPLADDGVLGLVEVS